MSAGTIVKIIVIAIIVYSIYLFIRAMIGIRAPKPIPQEEIDAENKKKGDKFENAVQKKLEKTFGVEVLKNLIICFPNGTTTEIDRLFINQKGVFVIECKSRSENYITGILTEKTWQSGGYDFKNPLLQNETHIKAIEQLNLLPGRERYCRNIVITNAENSLKYFGKNYSGELITFPNVRGIILSTKYSGAYDAFKAKVEKSPEILSPDEVRALTNALRGYQADQIERERHSTNIQSRMF